MAQFIAILILIVLFIYALPYLLGVLSLYLLYRLVRYIRKTLYFKSDKFKAVKAEVQSIVSEYNEISNYVDTMPAYNLLSTDSNKYDHAHLAKFDNTSKHKIKRNKNKKDLHNPFVRQSSLQVVRNASEEPIKYLTKYFDMKPNEETLMKLEEISSNINRYTTAIDNLERRKDNLHSIINPPKFIIKHYEEELNRHLEMDLPTINFEYPEYVFEYVSAGGNSSQRTTITFDEDTAEATAQYLAERVKYNKSAKAQRAIMTKKFREYIKERDDYTCQYCNASTATHELLLLEVDHITPVSKGGLSTEDNLQTLCWKCNRTKSNK